MDHRRRQNVVRTSVIDSAIASCAIFLSLLHFDVISDLLNRRTATLNLFVKQYLGICFDQDIHLKNNLVPMVLFPPRESTLVAAGHVSMDTNQICIGWEIFDLILSALSKEVKVALLFLS